MKSAIFRISRNGELATTAYRACHRRYCTAGEVNATENSKVIHPYRRIHPWKSETEFTNSLLKNIIYNADGMVVINKPYGIPIINGNPSEEDVPVKKIHKIVNAANYSIQNVLPFMAKELDVPALIPCTGAEKFMTGVYVFGINDDVCKEIINARARAISSKKFFKYWCITIRVPHHIEGSYHLAMTLQQSSLGNKKPIILTKWSNTAVKKKEVKILNINYKLLSNSTHNLSSLIELSMSTRKWHAIRLFASTMLYSPILGDNYHGSRVQEVMGTWIRVNPFAESCWNLPKLNKELLELLNVTQSQQEIIPAHTHLRSISLRSFGKEKKDIVLEAPLTHPFDWTCKQLVFKNIPDEANYESAENKVEEMACA